MTLRVHGDRWIGRSGCWIKFFFHGPKWPSKWKVIGKNEESGWLGGGVVFLTAPSVNETVHSG